MARFFALVKVQALSFFGINKRLNSEKLKSLSGPIGLLAVGLASIGAICGIAYFYANSFSRQLLLQGKIDLLIPLMIGISAIISFILTFYSVGSTLFGFKDYDLLSSMPIKPITVVLSKFFFIYVVDVIFCVLLSVPALGITISNAGCPSALQIVSMVIAWFVSPLLPLALATVVGMGVSYVSGKFKRKNLIQTLLYIVLFVGLMALLVLSSANSAAATTEEYGTHTLISKIYFLFPMLVDSGYNGLFTLAYASINICSATLVVAFVCGFYKKLNDIFSAKRTSRNYKLKEYKTRSAGRTLFNKEIKRMFSCPVYAINSLMGMVILVGLGIPYCMIAASANFGPDGGSAFFRTLIGLLNRFIPLFFTSMCLLSPPTTSSVSLEGQSLWILKTSPVSVNRILLTKLSVNTVFYGIPTFLFSVALGICAAMPVYDCILLVVIGISIPQFGGVFGLLMNLRFPKMKWESKTEVVKRSAPTFLSVLSSMFFTLAILAIIIATELSDTAVFGITAGLFSTLTVISYLILFKIGVKMFNKIN